MPNPTVQQGRALFIAFLESYLQIDFQGFQSGFGIRPDMILFRSPRGSTLAVNTDVMLLPEHTAHEIIKSKIAESEKAFGKAA